MLTLKPKTIKKEAKKVTADAMATVSSADKIISIRSTVGQRTWNKDKVMLDYVKVAITDKQETFEFGISLYKLQHLIDTNFFSDPCLSKCYQEYLALPKLAELVARS
jgi:hypothetical protein